MGAGNLVGKLARPVARRKAPGAAANFVRQAFDRAVDGAGPLRGAAPSADRRLAEHDGNVDKAIGALVDSHVRMAGAQGFVTNLGGLITMAVTIPANISGLALLQCHLVAGIAHLRGYDLDDPRVRNAVLACMLGEDSVKSLIKKKKLPSRPMAIATAPSHDPGLDSQIASEVTAELITRVAGKRTIAMIGRRMPVVGGGVGAVSDGYSTYQIGKYAAKELRSRK
ncbi:MAG: EcsC family protein [Nocardioidaceae bacterium]|nr:EcsC family protein [Nocardioidaceae bacterium]